MLSDRQVRALDRPNSIVADGGGLYLRVSAHGSKTFLYRSRKGGKARYVTLGAYPSLTLADARRKAGELQGKPLDHTVAYAVEQYLKSLQYARPEEVKRRLEKDIVPEIGAKKLSQITAGDISSALQKIVDRGSPVSANRTLADVRHVFDFAYGKGWINSDPSLRITRKVIGGREKSRDTVLTDTQLYRLIQALKTDRFALKTRVALALILATGQRPSEVLGIDPKEVKGEWWTIPAERTKNGRAQKVYLTHLARWLLKAVKHKLGGDHRALARAMSRFGGEYTPHDLRRTMSTKMADIGVPPHVIEKCLNHQMTGVMAVYNRAEYLAERKAAWKQWARYLFAVKEE